jgi:hypothetical protein
MRAAEIVAAGCFVMGAILAVGPLVSSCAPADSASQNLSADTGSLTEEVRKELLDAREIAWRSFFQKDPTLVEEVLGPEVIAIQQSAERWDNRDRLLAMAKGMSKQDVQLHRPEFPHTEFQLFGDTAILYYTYVFESGDKSRSVVDAGRGTEVFLRRDGKWVDVGWHLDNGPFVRKNGEWIRVGEPYPEPSVRGGQ